MALKQRAEQNVHTEPLGWEEEEEGECRNSAEHLEHDTPGEPSRLNLLSDKLNRREAINMKKSIIDIRLLSK